MKMNRNIDDHFAKTPTPHFPRSRFDMGIHKRLQTQGHGRLYPFFARVVYPGDTWKIDMSTFVRMDTSLRVPLDDIYLDTYFFFVPFRILDPNFAKVLGEVEPYDDEEYSIPQIEITGEDETPSSFGINCLLGYLGYSQAELTADDSGAYEFKYDDTLTAYPLAAYYKIYNDWFRDENVDESIPYTDLYGSNIHDYFGGGIFQDFDALRVNRYHDYFASAMISPQKGPAVTIPLGTSAPVGIEASASGTLVTPGTARVGAANQVIADGDFISLNTAFGSPNPEVASGPIIADLSQAAGTINQLRLSFAIQSLYERRGRFGTRYIETIRGQWGIEVPDSFFQRPEYLGGSRVTLNNVPVLSTENSSQLGQMSGNSATLSGGNSWTKTFIEYGIIIGLSCTRIKHSYTQGKRKEIWDLKTDLDLYNPVFANIGNTAIKQNEIYNKGSNNENVVFAYQEAWADLRSDCDSFAGLFGMWSTNNELKNKWHYGDYYASAPTFSSEWLKEDFTNVARTLTGQLINGAGSTETEGHQFMLGYYYHPVVTRILPSHSIPVELIGRL